MSKVFDIKDSVLRPFGRLDESLSGGAKMLVSDYVARNLTCGALDFDGINKIGRMASDAVNTALSTVGSMMGVVDSCVDKCLSIANMADTALAALDTLAGVVGDIMSLGHDIANIDFSLPDINLAGIGSAIVSAAKSAYNAVENAVKNLYEAAKDLVKDFATGVSGMFDFNGVDIPFEDPIEFLANSLSCQSAGLAGMLAAGLSAITDSFGITDEISSIASVSKGLIEKVSEPMGYALGAFKAANGVAALVDTAFGTSVVSSMNKSASACQAARSLNRFGTFDPFISAVTKSSTLSALSSGSNVTGVYRSGLDPSEADDCKCCVTKNRYENLERTVDVAAPYYHLQDGYALTRSGVAVPWQSVTSSSVPNDVYARTIKEQGLGSSNLLSRPLMVGLEALRLSKKLLGNSSEVRRDFGKYHDFDTEGGVDLRYVSSISKQVASTSYGNSRQIRDKIREMLA